MKTFLKSISCIILIGVFFFLLAHRFNYLQKPNPLENIEKRMDKIQKKDSKLIRQKMRRNLKTESQTKEWEK